MAKKGTGTQERFSLICAPKSNKNEPTELLGHAHFRRSFCSSGLFHSRNPFISLHHFYTISAWDGVEIYEVIIWLVM